MENKNFICSNLAIKTPAPVNMLLLVTFEKSKDEMAPIEGGRYQITFRRIEDTLTAKDIIWQYCSEEDRDCEYDKIKLNCTTKII
jgi:hypothetical protein